MWYAENISASDSLRPWRYINLLTYLLIAGYHNLRTAGGLCNVNTWIQSRLGEYTRMSKHITLLVFTGELSNSLMKYVCARVHVLTRSSADADNRLDAFSGQSRSTNMVPFHM